MPSEGFHKRKEQSSIRQVLTVPRHEEVDPVDRTERYVKRVFGILTRKKSLANKPFRKPNCLGIER